MNKRTVQMQRIHPISILLLVFLLVACSKPDSSILLEGIKAEEAGKNDEAMTAYEKILNEFPDGESAPEATFRLASLYQGHKSDLLKAATMYESIGQNYPDSSKQVFTNCLKDIESLIRYTAIHHFPFTGIEDIDAIIPKIFACKYHNSVKPDVKSIEMI